MLTFMKNLKHILANLKRSFYTITPTVSQELVLVTTILVPIRKKARNCLVGQRFMIIREQQLLVAKMLQDLDNRPELD